MKAFDTALGGSKKGCFDKLYGEKQLHLLILATHPEHNVTGWLSHCEWGLGLAKEQKTAVTIFSSPMGSKLYTQLGFKMLDHVMVQVEERLRNCLLESWPMTSTFKLFSQNLRSSLAFSWW
jgi:hypothetical protein